MTNLPVNPDPMLCVACGEGHADPSTATRIGISYVAAECAWTLRYPGMSAAEVIETLEARLEGRAPVKPPPERDADVALASGDDHTEQWHDDDPDKTTVMEPVSDDPAERAEQNQYAEDVLCPVCSGDGELVTPDGERDGAVMCARCNGSGRVLVRMP